MLSARSGRQAHRDRAGAEASRHAGRAVRGRSAHAGHDRHRVPAARCGRCCPTPNASLLTAYADSEAAIAAINEVGLDHYLMKPWDPPEQRLYPVLDDLLADWAARARAAVRRRPRRRVALVAAELRHARLPVAQPDPVSVDRRRSGRVDARARASPRSATTWRGCRVVLLADGTALAMPSHAELAAKVGLQTDAHASVLRPGRHRRRPGRAGVRGLRRVRRAEGRC